MVNPFKTIYQFYERSGTRLDIPVLKRMFIEIPHIPIGLAISFASIVGIFTTIHFFHDQGIGYQSRYTVLRSDDPLVPRFRKEVINADQYSK